MVELSPPSPREEASPNNDTELIVLPNLPGTSSSSPRAAVSSSLPPDRENADALLSRDRSPTPPTAVTPPRAASPEMKVRPATEQPREPSRQSSPETPGRRSPDPTISLRILGAPRTQTTTARQVRDDLTSPWPSPSPKGKRRINDLPPPADSGSGATPTRLATPEPRSDISDDAPDGESTNPSLPLVPDEKQREIDEVIATVPMKGPRLEADSDTDIEVDDTPEVDEGFYEESMESRYQAFLAATESLRSRRRASHRFQRPGTEKQPVSAHMGLTHKAIRMRRGREPKPGPPISDPSSSASASSAAASSSLSTAPARPPWPSPRP